MAYFAIKIAEMYLKTLFFRYLDNGMKVVCLPVGRLLIATQYLLWRF